MESICTMQKVGLKLEIKFMKNKIRLKESKAKLSFIRRERKLAEE
jgi:hypothetical protein